jgi:hypothetical protein
MGIVLLAKVRVVIIGAHIDCIVGISGIKLDASRGISPGSSSVFSSFTLL